MDVFPKFIIETDEQLGDCLIVAKCTYHKQLVTFKEKVKGGGWHRFNKDTNTFIFYGDSTDFGKASIDDIQNCINLGNVYTNASLSKSIANKHNFEYYDYSSYTKFQNPHIDEQKNDSVILP